MIHSNYQVTYRDANTQTQIIDLYDCVKKKLHYGQWVLNGKQLINRVWVKRHIHCTEIIELKPLHEVSNHNWNFIKRTATKTKLDAEVKFFSQNKHKLKPKPKQQVVKIKKRIMKQIDLTGRYSPVPDLEKATNDALAEWYNKHSGSTIQLDAKSKRETLVSKVTGLKEAMDELASRATSPSNKTAGSKTTKTNMSKKANKTAKGKTATKGTKGAKKEKATRTDSKLAGMLIYKKTDKNPRREGSIGFKSFAAIKNGMTYHQYIDAGGRNKDLRWDEEHGYVQLKPAPKAAAKK